MDGKTLDRGERTALDTPSVSFMYFNLVSSLNVFLSRSYTRVPTPVILQRSGVTSTDAWQSASICLTAGQVKIGFIAEVLSRPGYSAYVTLGNIDQQADELCNETISEDIHSGKLLGV